MKKEKKERGRNALVYILAAPPAKKFIFINPQLDTFFIKSASDFQYKLVNIPLVAIKIVSQESFTHSLTMCPTNEQQV